MKIRIFTLVLLSAAILMLFTNCQLNPQRAKEKMAFNNFMKELKETQMMEGKIGNVKYIGDSSISFDFLDSTLADEEMELIAGRVLTTYVNNNNSAQTGITVLKVFANASGRKLKAVYQAGPAARPEDLINFTWQ